MWSNTYNIYIYIKLNWSVWELIIAIGMVLIMCYMPHFSWIYFLSELWTDPFQFQLFLKGLDLSGYFLLAWEIVLFWNHVTSIRHGFKWLCFVVCRKTTQTWAKVSHTTDDDHAWRKYGQKEILNAKHPRSLIISFLQGCSFIRR